MASDVSGSSNRLGDTVDVARAAWAASVAKLLNDTRLYAGAQTRRDRDMYLAGIVNEAVRVRGDELGGDSAPGPSPRDEWLRDYPAPARAVYRAATALADEFRHNLRSVTEAAQVLSRLAKEHKFLDLARKYATGEND